MALVAIVDDHVDSLELFEIALAGIAVSAVASEYEPQKALDAGFCDYIIKPIEKSKRSVS